MSDLEQIVNGEQPEVVVEPEVIETPAPTPEPEKVPEPVAVAEPVKADEPAMVPVGVVQELRRELRELKQATQPAQPAPEFIDPEGAAFMQRQMASMQANIAAERSEMMARMAHTSETVDEAMKAAEAAGVVDQFRGQRDPWGAMTQWHKAQIVHQEIGGDPMAYKARIEQEAMAKARAEVVAEQARERAGQPAPSMANVTGTGGGPKTTWVGPTPLDKVIGN